MNNNDIKEIINRIFVATGTTNESQICDYLGKKSRGVVWGWKSRGKIPDSIINLISFKTGYRKEWLLTGELPEKEPTDNALMMVRESGDNYAPGTTMLTKQEKNELTMLRYLAKHHPKYRQRLSDEIQEIYILATTSQEG